MGWQGSTLRKSTHTGTLGIFADFSRDILSHYNRCLEASNSHRWMIRQGVDYKKNWGLGWAPVRVPRVVCTLLVEAKSGEDLVLLEFPEREGERSEYAGKCVDRPGLNLSVKDRDGLAGRQDVLDKVGALLRLPPPTASIEGLCDLPPQLIGGMVEPEELGHVGDQGASHQD